MNTRLLGRKGGFTSKGRNVETLRDKKWQTKLRSAAGSFHFYNMSTGTSTVLSTKCCRNTCSPYPQLHILSTCSAPNLVLGSPEYKIFKARDPATQQNFKMFSCEIGIYPPTKFLSWKESLGIIISLLKVIKMNSGTTWEIWLWNSAKCYQK